MGVERRRDGDDGSEDGDSFDGSEDGDSSVTTEDGDSSTARKPSDSETSAGRVHVRRLDVLDTLRWSWEVLGDRRELVGLALAVNLLSVVATLGVTRPSPTGDPEFASWVLWLYLGQFLATLVVWGVVYLTAADAVAHRSRSLARHLVAATKLLPLLAVTALTWVVLVALSLVPAAVVTVAMRDATGVAFGVGLLAVSGLALFGVYVFHRLLLAYPACVIDRKAPGASARAGWTAGTGIVRKVFAVGVVYVLATVASNVVSSQFGGQYDVPSTLVSATFGALFLPLFGLAQAHLYLEGSRNR